MSEQEFADMFERYAKTRRGIEFLSDYFQKNAQALRNRT